MNIRRDMILSDLIRPTHRVKRINKIIFIELSPKPRINIYLDTELE